MKKNSDSTEDGQPARKKGGRPVGSTNKEPAGALALTFPDIISAIAHQTGYTSEPAAAVLKEPKPQGGNDGKAVGGRIYVPAGWIGSKVLCLRLTDKQAATLEAMNLKKQYDEMMKKASTDT